MSLTIPNYPKLLLLSLHTLPPVPCSRLDAVAHGGNHGSRSWGEPPLAALPSQDRAASLFPIPCSLFSIPYSILQENHPLAIIKKTENIAVTMNCKCSNIYEQ